MAVAVDETTVDLIPLSSPSDAQTVTGSQAPSAADLDSKTNGHTTDASVIPKVNVNGEPVSSPRPSASFGRVDAEDARWGSNFWVTLVDPQTSTVFFACPATGQVSWDPPAAYLQVRRESGGSSATTPVVESHTITKPRQERQSGNVQIVLSFP
jgi:hypothetical protein